MSLRLAAAGSSQKALAEVARIDLERSDLDAPGRIRRSSCRKLHAVAVRRKRGNLDQNLFARVPAGAGEGGLLARCVVGLVGIEHEILSMSAHSPAPDGMWPVGSGDEFHRLETPVTLAPEGSVSRNAALS